MVTTDNNEVAATTGEPSSSSSSVSSSTSSSSPSTSSSSSSSLLYKPSVAAVQPTTTALVRSSVDNNDHNNDDDGDDIITTRTTTNSSTSMMEANTTTRRRRRKQDDDGKEQEEVQKGQPNTNRPFLDDGSMLQQQQQQQQVVGGGIIVVDSNGNINNNRQGIEVTNQYNRRRPTTIQRISTKNQKREGGSTSSSTTTTAVGTTNDDGGQSLLLFPTPSVSIMCGLTAGILQAGLFNPFDRALYLSVKNEVPFLRWENFNNPYTGFFQSVGHRALSGGLYYPLETFFCALLVDDHYDDLHPSSSTSSSSSSSSLLSFQQHEHYHVTLHPALANFVAGSLAGTTMAIILNPVAAIKYKSWGREVNRGMVTEAMEMFHKGGLRPFGNGLVPTIIRDLVFGGTYTFLRLEIQYRLMLRPDQQWGANMVAAALATIVSGPFNLARNVQYATRSRHVADTVTKVLVNFIHETTLRPTLSGRLHYVQGRLRVGWGTVRVAVGMSFGHYVYDTLMGMMM